MQEEKNGGNADSSRKEEKAAKREVPMKNENKQIKNDTEKTKLSSERKRKDRKSFRFV